MNAHPADDPFAELEIIERPAVRLIDELVDYWDLKRAGRMAPRRADIDPTELPQHLPHVCLLDVIGGGADFRYRLIGTRIVEGLGRDVTGKALSELYSERPLARQTLADVFKMTVDRKCPVYARGRVFWMPDRDFLRFAAGFVPLSDDGSAVNMILSELFVAHAGKFDT